MQWHSPQPLKVVTHNHTVTVFPECPRDLLSQRPRQRFKRVPVTNTRGCHLRARSVELSFFSAESAHATGLHSAWLALQHPPGGQLKRLLVWRRGPEHLSVCRAETLQEVSASPRVAGTLWVFVQIIGQWQDVASVAEMCGVAILTSTVDCGNWLRRAVKMEAAT